MDTESQSVWQGDPTRTHQWFTGVEAETLVSIISSEGVEFRIPDHDLKSHRSVVFYFGRAVTVKSLY